MSAPRIELKSNTYLELSEVKEWLKIKDTDTSLDNIVTRLINAATDRVEQYIDGPVMAREYTEIRDGNSSDTITLAYWPILSLSEVIIDYAGVFDNQQPLDPTNYVLRGIPSIDQNPDTTLHGGSVVLRSDRTTAAIIGRIFAGSTVQSVRVKYKAGLAVEKQAVPGDLSYATLLLVEYLYILRENRELNVTSKTSMGGMSYNRDLGIPKEITDILDDYKDYSLGTHVVPQRNVFGL